MSEAVAVRPARQHLGIEALVALVGFVTALDNTIITVALPTAATELHLGPAELEWVGVSYMLSFSGLLMVGGSAVDRWGQRRLLLVGLAGFGAAAAVGGLAGGAALLIAARTAQGGFAALIMPAALSVVRTSLPERDRDTATAVWTAALAVALAVGPLLGGALTQYLRWNWVLLVNVPIAVLGLVLASWVVPEHRARTSTPIDWPGAALGTATGLAGTALLIGLSGGGGPVLIGLCAVAVVGLGIGFVLVERRSAAPLLPPELLRHRLFGGGLALQLCWGLGVSGVFFFTPMFLQDALGLRPAQSGLPLLAVAVAVVAATPFVAGAVRRFGAARPIAVGLLVVAGGLAAVALPGPRPAVLALLPGLVLVGVGSAFTTPITSTALTAIGAGQAGIAGGVLSASRELASSVGVALIGAVLNLRRAAALTAGASMAHAYSDGFLAGLLVAAAIEVLAALLAVKFLTKG